MSFIRIFLMVTWTFSLMLVVPLLIPFVFNRQFPLYVARVLFAPGLLWLAGLKWKVEGAENVPKDRPVIFISNHCSHLDIGCLCASVPVNLHFIGKKELIKVPVIGWYMFIAGHIFIDRTNRKKAVESLAKAVSKIKQGKSIIMYPEGTRSKTGELGSLKKGAFHLALQAEVDIVPINIEGTHLVWPTQTWQNTPGNVTIRIGKPIDTSKYDSNSLRELVEEGRNEILKLRDQ